MTKEWECPKCGKITPKDKQFCKHCSFNIGYYYSDYKKDNLYNYNKNERLSKFFFINKLNDNGSNNNANY